MTAAAVYITPPSVLTKPPASVAELADYAHRAGWTAKIGPLRSLGIGWHRLIGVPTTAVCRYVEWIAQRPGRSVFVFALWKLIITVGPGPWITHNILTPLGDFAGWLFL